MDRCLRSSGRAVPYSGGGVTPVTLTPNFEFPIGVTNLQGKTMTASTPVTEQDLIDNLTFQDEEGADVNVVDVSSGLFLKSGSDEFNQVTLSSDGLTITFGGTPGGPTLTGFTYNA